MIVDSSAILAILFNEDDAESYARAITDAEAMALSTASLATKSSADAKATVP